MAVLSYLLLIWWEYVAFSANEFGFFSMLAADLSAYWLAADQPAAVSVPLLSMPGEIGSDSHLLPNSYQCTNPYLGIAVP